jgi:sugar-specific transcriptional regulator TrmB
MKERVRPLLDNIGFSELETDVYVALRQEPGASGYRVAQIIGKPVGSTYKALETLRAKGAIVSDETTRPTTFSALPIREYIDARRRDLEALQARIETELEDVVTTPAHAGIFELTSVGQVYQRCRELLRSAQTVALLNIDTRPLEELRSELEAAADRGVRVLIKTRAPAQVPGCGIMAPAQARPLPSPGVSGDEEIAVAVDCREYVQAFLTSDGSEVEEAVWVRRPRLASEVCCLFQNDFTLTRVRAMVQAGKEVREIGHEMQRLGRMVEVQALPELMPQEWVLTDARKGVQKRRRAQPEPQAGRVTLRQIECIIVASSRTVTIEPAGIMNPDQPPPEGTDVPPPDADAFNEPLY